MVVSWCNHGELGLLRSGPLYFILRYKKDSMDSNTGLQAYIGFQAMPHDSFNLKAICLEVMCVRLMLLLVACSRNSDLISSIGQL